MSSLTSCLVNYRHACRGKTDKIGRQLYEAQGNMLSYVFM